MLFWTETQTPLSLKFNKRKDFIQKDVIAKNQDALKSTVNVIKAVYHAQVYAYVMGARIVKTEETKMKIL